MSKPTSIVGKRANNKLVRDNKGLLWQARTWEVGDNPPFTEFVRFYNDPTTEDEVVDVSWDGFTATSEQYNESFGL